MIRDHGRRASGGRLRKLGPRIVFAAVLAGILAGCSSCGSVSPGATLLLTFVRPTDGQQLGLSDETDPLTPGFQSDIQVQVRDSKGATLQPLTAQLQLRLSSDSAWTAGPDAQISGGTVSFSKLTLPAGTVVLQVTVTEAATQRTSTGTVTIGVPTVHSPIIQFTSPTPGNYTSRMLNVAATVTGEAAEGQPVDIYDQVGVGVATKIGTLTVHSGHISGALVFVNGTHIVSGTITDSIGNPGTSTSVFNVVVTSLGCTVAITRPATSPVYFNRNDDEDPATPGLQYTLRGVSSDCLGVPVQLLKGAVNPTLIATTTTDGTTGAFSFYITLQDGEQTRLTAQMTDPNSSSLITSASVDVTGVKLTPPVISNVVPPQSNLFCVADSNYHLFLTPPTPGYIQDKIPDGNCEADFSFTVTNANGGVASLTYQGSRIQRAITADPQSVSFISAVLPQRTSGQLSFQATDVAGNTAVQTANMTVDVIPPAPSTVTKAIAPGAARTATVNVSWTASGDDGDAGTPSGYDLRWSTNAVLPGTIFDGGYVDGGILDDPTYFDLTKVVQQGGAPFPPNTLNSQLTPLPPLASYSIQVRALDAIGNYARISPQADLPNFLSSAGLVNPGAPGAGFGAHLAKADFNVDGADDLVVGAGLVQPGAVWIYYGGPSFWTTPPQQLSPYDGQNGNFGLDFSTGDVGNPDGGVPAPDLLISQNTWSTGRGRAFLYFGRQGAQIDPNTFVEFRGTNLAPPAGGFSGTSRIISDINSDGLGEVMITAHRESAGVGKVFLFYGRSQEQWMAAMTATDNPDGGAPFYIPTSAADRIFTGDGPPDNFFGRVRGYADLGNLMRDGGMAFTVPASLDTVNKVFIHSGPVVNTKPDGGTVAVSDAIQTLQRASVTDGGTLFGFGYEAFGNVNLVGSPANDLVVTQPRNNQVLIYPDGTPSGFNTAPQIINGINNNFGVTLSHGDINLDGRLDIVVGENGSGAGQQAWIFYNRGTPGSEFDANAGAGFFQSRLFSPHALGIGVVVGDFNGDGRADVAAGDNLDGTGKVTVWY